MSTENINLFQIKSVSGLPEEEKKLLDQLVEVWGAKKARNQLRDQYYNSKNKLKDLGISIPPALQNIETVVGWPAKAVDALAVRSRFDGFTFASGEENAELQGILSQNRFNITIAQATHSELINSVAFLTVSRGGKGEPKAIISAYSALNAAALWDYRRKRIKAGLTIVDIKQERTCDVPEPIWVNLYTDTDVWEIKRDNGAWRARRNPHSMGRPMMEPLVYRPTLDRPFGKSRISRAVMSITDSAVRTALRSEVGSEFYTAPQKWILGAEDSLFADKTKWEAYIGSWFAVSKDEDGEKPTVGQFSQGTMQPHTDYMRSLAARFSGETSIPVSELGVIHDNPSSAEAIYASKESLVIEAEALNETNGEALKVIGMMVLAVSQNKPLDELTDDERSITPRFKNPAMPSIVSQADAVVKMISAIPWIAGSQVALEELGFNEDQITRLLSDKRKMEARSMLQQQEQAPQQAHEATMYEVQSIIKGVNAGSITKGNAIQLFERIGIDQEEAEEILADTQPKQTQGGAVNDDPSRSGV